MIPHSLSEPELQALIARAQEGETEAFERIYEAYFAPVYRYASFRLPKEIAEDTVAEIFVKAWEKLPSYKQQGGIPFAAWLFRIARHAVIDVYRSHRGFEEMPDNVPDSDSFNRAESRIERSELNRIVRGALKKLPYRYREVLMLSYMGDLPTHEVARVLRLTAGGVRILKFRALRKLEALLPTDFQA